MRKRRHRPVPHRRLQPFQSRHLYRHHGRSAKGFAAANQVARRIQFQLEGACDNCQGLGVIYTEIPPSWAWSKSLRNLRGKRFKDEVLEYKLQGKSIADMLEMTVREALNTSSIGRNHQQAAGHQRCGPRLSHPRSAVEHPFRWRMSAHQARQRTPQARQHLRPRQTHYGSAHVGYQPPPRDHRSPGRRGQYGDRDRAQPSVIKHADWIIDMGPEGGNKGGRVMFEGTPKQLLTAKNSLTSEYIRR